MPESFPEPTAAELAAIDAEWPVIAAELAVTAAECRLAVCPDVLAVRAHRRAVAALSVVVREAHRAAAPVAHSAAVRPTVPAAAAAVVA